MEVQVQHKSSGPGTKTYPIIHYSFAGMLQSPRPNAQVALSRQGPHAFRPSPLLREEPMQRQLQVVSEGAEDGGRYRKHSTQGDNCLDSS